MSETAQSESRSEDSAAGKTDGEIKAIAAETEIAAIEEVAHCFSYFVTQNQVALHFWTT